MKKIKKYYKHGFFTKLKNDQLPYGINKDIIKSISYKRNEPKWMLNFRLKAYNKWLYMNENIWFNGYFKEINYQDYIYYSSPINIKNKKNKNNLFNKEVKYTFSKLGIGMEENKIAIDAIFDSVSVKTTYKNKLSSLGIIFCSLSQAVNNYPDLVKKYLGSIVSIDDNPFAALNSAVFSEGTFIYLSKNIKCNIELSSYFRINSKNIGQFERTLIIADDNSYASYIEGCSAPAHNKHQLHSAVVEIIINKKAHIKYSTIQNWFSGNNYKSGGVLNCVTKKALCIGDFSKMSWIQLESGSAINWKYPSIILKGNNSIGNFFSITSTNNNQQSDTGTKIIHIGKNTNSTVISKNIASGKSINTYRGLVEIKSKSLYSRNFSKCESILIGNDSKVSSMPCINVNNNKSILEHESLTSEIEENQLFYCLQRCISMNEAIKIIVTGFCNDILSKLPLEFVSEAKKLLEINLIKD